MNLYGNKICEIVLPKANISNLKYLNIGYNNLTSLPDDMNILSSLHTLKVMNNLLEHIPTEVCEFDLKVLDVSSNPLIQPPLETSERGIESMRRYYQCLHAEEEARKNTLSKIKNFQSKKLKPENKSISYNSLTQKSMDAPINYLMCRRRPKPEADKIESITLNDTLKVVFVGMAFSGKTSIIKCLIDGKKAKIPKKEERTIGVDINEWDPSDLNKDVTKERSNVQTRIKSCDGSVSTEYNTTHVKFSIWDFAGKYNSFCIP